MGNLIIPSERVKTLVDEIRTNHLGRGETLGRIWRELQALSAELHHPLIIMLGMSGMKIRVSPSGAVFFRTPSAQDIVLFLFSMKESMESEFRLNPSEMEALLAPGWDEGFAEGSPERTFIYASERLFEDSERVDAPDLFADIHEVVVRVGESVRFSVIVRGIFTALQKGEESVTVRMGEQPF